MKTTSTTGRRTLANAITDAMNDAVPWLWWPLDVPDETEPLPPGAHVLYAVHGVLIDRAARRAGLRVEPRLAVVLGIASWWWFTEAWNSRAYAATSSRECDGAV